MGELKPDGPFVSAAWLAARRQAQPDLAILDTTWVLPGEDDPLPGQSIKDAKEFDIGRLKAATPLGEPFDDAGALAQLCNDCDITPASIVVLYDRQGLFSAPRARWSLGTAGFSQVYILRGGLPEWLAFDDKDNRAQNTAELGPGQTLNFPVMRAEDVKAAIGTGMQIIDARSAGRFHGLSPEPRADMKSGHIPGSINLPFSSLKTDDGRLKSKKEVQTIIKAAEIDLSRPIITTCGSGVTAAALAMIFEWLGYPHAAVYSGSWAEWGAQGADWPVET